jgi:hypothetical protein
MGAADGTPIAGVYQPETIEQENRTVTEKSNEFTAESLA